jgi:hypothetical protein
LLPSHADALPFLLMNANAGPTNGQGDECTAGFSQSSFGGGIFPASSSWTCNNSEGSNSATAKASQGSLGASAHAISKVGVNLGSLSRESSEGSATYSDNTLIFLGFDPSGHTTTTLNVNFSANVSKTPDNAFASAVAAAFVSGTEVAACSNVGSGTDCGSIPFTVPLNTFLTITLQLQADAQANASGLLPASGDQVADADASHTFSFPLLGPVFNLAPGITVEDDSAFIFGNKYVPPGTPTAVPEPNSLMLLLGALGGLIGMTAIRRVFPLPSKRHCSG